MEQRKSIKVGFCCGTESSFPEAIKALLHKVGQGLYSDYYGTYCDFEFEYVPVAPFNIEDDFPYDFIIDRVSHWRLFVREWLKTAILDGAYVFNNPHSFESKKKNYGFSAMVRLGLPVPETFLLPTKDKLGIPQDVINRFDLDFDPRKLAKGMEDYCFLKPHDGGGWRNVNCCEDLETVQRIYDSSGRLILNLQKGIPFEKYVRCLCIGDSILPISYQPDAPYHEKYEVVLDFLTAEESSEIVKYCRLLNAFHGFEINSAEFLINDGIPWLIDFNNPVPDMSVVCLHCHFPWAIKEMVKMIIKYGLAGKNFPFNLQTGNFLKIGRDKTLDMTQKLESYEKLWKNFYQTDRCQRVSEQTFNESYHRAESDFFCSQEYLTLVEQELYRSFNDTSDTSKYERFYQEYMVKMGLNDREKK